jgi:hypothetical protein
LASSPGARTAILAFLAAATDTLFDIKFAADDESKHRYWFLLRLARFLILGVFFLCVTVEVLEAFGVFELTGKAHLVVRATSLVTLFMHVREWRFLLNVLSKLFTDMIDGFDHSDDPEE